MICTCTYPDVIEPGCPVHTAADRTHTFQVTVTGCTAEQAETVIAERLSHDEDYGFGYLVSYQDQPDELTSR